MISLSKVTRVGILGLHWVVGRRSHTPHRISCVVVTEVEGTRLVWIIYYWRWLLTWLRVVTTRRRKTVYWLLLSIRRLLYKRRLLRWRLVWLLVNCLHIFVVSFWLVSILRRIQSRLVGWNDSFLLHNPYFLRLNIPRSIFLWFLFSNWFPSFFSDWFFPLFVFLIFYFGSPGRSHRYHIFKHIWMPDSPKIIAEHSEGLIIGWFALEPIKCPVGPVNIRFFQIFDQILPRNIPIIITKLSQKIRYAHSPHKCLLIKETLLKGLVRYQIPWCYSRLQPTPVIKMTRVNQLVRNTQRKRRFKHSRQIYLVT